MAPAAINFDDLLKGIPKGAWVAVSEDQVRVVEFGFDMREVLEKARAKGERNPIMMRVPESTNALIF